MWICPECETQNSDIDTICVVCNQPKSVTSNPKKLETADSAESIIWMEAKKTNTESGYRHYLDQYPDGKYVQSANRALMHLYRNRDAVEWENAKQKDSILGYYEYLGNSFCSTANRKLAKQRIEELLDDRDWATAQRSDTIVSYEHYIQEHLNNETRRKQATSRIIALKEIRKRHKYNAAEEEQEWHWAQEKNVLWAYQRYERLYPSGKYISECQEAIKSLSVTYNSHKSITDKKKPPIPKWLFILGLVIILIAFIACVMDESPDANRMAGVLSLVGIVAFIAFLSIYNI